MNAVSLTRRSLLLGSAAALVAPALGRSVPAAPMQIGIDAGGFDDMTVMTVVGQPGYFDGGLVSRDLRSLYIVGEHCEQQYMTSFAALRGRISESGASSKVSLKQWTKACGGAEEYPSPSSAKGSASPLPACLSSPTRGEAEEGAAAPQVTSPLVGEDSKPARAIGDGMGALGEGCLAHAVPSANPTSTQP